MNNLIFKSIELLPLYLYNIDINKIGYNDRT